ncbi:hypothetical protein GCM10028806_53830 [Spirosoma terrae]
MTVMTLPVWPLLHATLPEQPLADRLTGVPTVTLVALAARLRVGNGFTVTVLVVDPEQAPTVHVAE